MGLIRERDQDDDGEQGGSSPWVDLGLRVCPACRRELMGWEQRCPADGSEGVPQASLLTDGVPAIPAHLLEDDDDVADADAAPNPDPASDIDPVPDTAAAPDPPQ